MPSFLASQNDISADFIRLLDERAHTSNTFTIPNFDHSLRLLAYECKPIQFNSILSLAPANRVFVSALFLRHRPDRLRQAFELHGRADMPREHCPVRECGQ